MCYLPLFYAISCIIGLISLTVCVEQEIFQQITNESIYNKKLRPFYGSREPMEVFVSLHLFGMSTLNDLTSEYQMQMLLRLHWLDERLAFNWSREGSEVDEEQQDKIVGDHWHANRMWTPTLHVVNDRGAGSISNNVEGNILLHLKPNGTVLLSNRIQLQLMCNMNYHYYPMDKQTCWIIMESSILSTKNLFLKWFPERSVLLNDNFNLPGFTLTQNTVDSDIASYRRTGNFSRLKVKFSVKREFGHFLLDVYVPNILFVLTSWTSFWLDIPSAPARVSIGTGLMLTLVTSSKSVREKLPRYSYISALDIWTVVCTIFVFATLVEYALVNFIYHKDKRRRHPRREGSFCSDISSFSRSNRASFSSLYNLSHQPIHNDVMDSPPEPVRFSIGPPEKEMNDGNSVFKISVPNLLSVPKSLGHGVKNHDSTLTTVNSTEPQQEGGCLVPWTDLFTTPAHMANSIDRKCRIGFPVAFLLFNVVYWLVYGADFFRDI